MTRQPQRTACHPHAVCNHRQPGDGVARLVAFADTRCACNHCCRGLLETRQRPRPGHGACLSESGPASGRWYRPSTSTLLTPSGCCGAPGRGVMSGEGPGRGVAAFPSGVFCKSPLCESVPSRGGPLSDAFTIEGAQSSPSSRSSRSAAIVAAVRLLAGRLRLLLTLADTGSNCGDVIFRGRFPQGGSEK